MQKLQRIHLSDPRSLSVFMIVLAIILFGALLVQPVFAATNVFSNTGSISIPYFGNADPYPSTISVSGITDTVTDVNVTISGMSHTYVPDIDILLVGPGGQNVMLMSDAGGSRGVDNITLTLDSDALESIPAYSFFPFPSGTYLPTNYEGGSDTMLAPAPAEPFGTSLDVFDGVNPNGSWSLYVRDGTTGDNGSISGGWSLNITTSDAPTITSANAATVVSGTAFTHTFTASGNPAPTLSYVPGALPAGVTLAGNVFSGTPTVPGTYTVNVTAINGISPDAAQTFTLTVAAAPPTITSANNTTFTEGSAGSFTVTATGTAPITYGLSGAPAWVSINSSSGALSGTPPAGSAATGSFTFTITADNAALGNATQSFTLNVTGTPPAFTSTDNASVLATTSFSHTFAYTG
ncbi:MAG: putative Ig domain-containing protein, partial [Anaerolineae bacterium]|nr:putative Ig domain-containing protein [Anaerolineae bacterium]